jgi:1-acyl-sn-glycerol-3-phosphate acyltransferase
VAEPGIVERVSGSAPLRRRQALARRVSTALGRVEIGGLGSIPSAGPVLLAGNHRSLLDGPLLFGAVRRPVSFLVKSEAFTPLLAALLRSCGQIPVRRDIADARAVRVALRILRAGGVVGIFPEGARGHGLAETAKPGVGYLALRAGATVVPVACAGTAQMAHRRTWRRPPAMLLVGAPIAVERWPDERALRRTVAVDTTESIRIALAALVAVADDAPAGGTGGRTVRPRRTERARD